MDVPHVKREDYQLTDISDDGYLTLMADNGDLREDLKIPDGDLGTQLRTDFDSGKELLVSFLLSIHLVWLSFRGLYYGAQTAYMRDPCMSLSPSRKHGEFYS